MDLCDLISENPVEACDQLLAMYNERGEIIKALKAKLDELTHGIPIERAKEDGTLYNWHDGKSWRYVWYQLDGWTDGTITKVSKDTFFIRQQLNMFRPKIVFPLPSQTQEGS